MRTPRPGPTSSTTSVGRSSARRPITPRMFSSTRKCWPSCFFGTTLTARTRRSRSRRSWPRAPRALAARLGERGERVADVRRLVAAAAQRLGREVGAVGLGEQAVGRDAACGLPQLGRLGVGDVACERDVPAALERRSSRAGEEKQWRTTVPPNPARLASVSSSAARVWITTAFSSSSASASWPSNSRAAPGGMRSRGSSRARSHRSRPRARR